VVNTAADKVSWYTTCVTQKNIRITAVITETAAWFGLVYWRLMSLSPAISCHRSTKYVT